MKGTVKLKKRLEALGLALLFMLQSVLGFLPGMIFSAAGAVKSIEVWDSDQLIDYGYRFNMKFQPNYGNETMRMTKQKLTFLKYVDGAVFSCDVKQIKPEPEIYRTLIERYHLEPEKSVFLDDRKENCEAAEKFGIHAIQFHSFKQGTVELEKLGVK